MQKLSRYGFSLPAVMLGIALSGTPAMADVTTALHKALYELKMVSAEPGAGLNGVNGKMYFEQDATCDAWITGQRITTNYQYVDVPAVADTGRYAALESKDGKQFDFNADRQENGEMTEQIRGTVERAADGAARAVYSRPEGTKYDLPAGYYLPTAHTMEVVRHALAGDHFFSAVVFDGTDADGPVEIGTFIGKKVTAEELSKISSGKSKIDASLLTPNAWHIRMAVFTLKDEGESTPDYEMEIILHDNGVISHAVVDYKTFVIEQNLTALEKLPSKKCN